MQNIVRFYAIEPNIEIPEEMWEKQNSSALCWAICTQIASLLFLMIDILYIYIFVQFHPLENKMSLSQKFRKKCNYSATCSAIFTKSWQMPICVRITLNIKFYKILLISFWATLGTKFLSHTYRHTGRETDRQADIFQKWWNCVQDIPKRVNLSKTGNQKFARNQYFPLFI